MPPVRARVITIACAVAAIAACSKSGRAASAGTNTAESATTSSAVDTGSDEGAPIECSKIFAPADVAGILKVPATVSNYPYRTGSCTFEAANGGGSVRLYSGTDITNELTWNDVSKSVHRSKFVPLPGVGDEALRLASTGTEVYARKGKLYCAVLLIDAGQSGTPTQGEELSKKMGALCTRIFALK
mgnify:CR=1 FL=1